MTFPAGPILSTAAPHREHTSTPSAVYGASANGDGEQVGSAGSDEFSPDTDRGYTTEELGAVFSAVFRPMSPGEIAEATELAD